MRDTVSDTMNIVGLTRLDVQLTQHAVALSLELVSFLVQIKNFFSLIGYKFSHVIQPVRI